MNFTEFSFWWILLSLGLPFLGVRWLCQKFLVWTPKSDRIALLFLSLFLFWNAAHNSFIIFVIELLFNYSMVRWMQRYSGWKAKALATFIITIDLLVLVYFKYIIFLIRNIAVLVNFSSIELQDTVTQFNASRIPPGISFYTFQMVGFVVDSLKPSEHNKVRFIDYLNFASFFPQVVAGPIERRSALLPQLESWQLKFSFENFEKGLQWGIFGFFMKFVMADNIAGLIDPLLGKTDNPWLIILTTYLFGFRIYYDFAGYSFIALGIARVLGINLTINFLAPYAAKDVQDFWRRWHVTLSTWFRDYIYIPLGGSRVHWAIINILTVFAISGLWHGAGWNFVIWGLFHGGLLVIHRLFHQKISMLQPLGWFLTFSCVMFSWIFFMNPDFNLLVLKLNTLFTPAAYTIDAARTAYQSFNLISRGVLVLIMSISHLALLMEYLNVWRFKVMPYTTFVSPWLARILLPLIIWLAAQGQSEFIYFEF